MPLPVAAGHPLRLLARILVFLAALVAVVFAVNNRAVVTLDLWPWTATEAPVYAVALVAGFGGYCLGGFAAWLHAGRWRARARDAERRAERAEHALAQRTIDERERATPAGPAAREWAGDPATPALPPA